MRCRWWRERPVVVILCYSPIGHQSVDGLFQHIPELFGQRDVLNVRCLFKQWGDVIGIESRYAAADGSDEEMEFGMLTGIFHEFVDVGLDGLRASLHGGDGIRLSLHSYALSHYGTEMQSRRTCRAAGVDALQV